MSLSQPKKVLEYACRKCFHLYKKKPEKCIECGSKNIEEIVKAIPRKMILK